MFMQQVYKGRTLGVGEPHGRHLERWEAASLQMYGVEGIEPEKGRSGVRIQRPRSAVECACAECSCPVSGNFCPLELQMG